MNALGYLLDEVMDYICICFFCWKTAVLFTAMGLILALSGWCWFHRKRFKLTKLDISLGGIGKVEITPNTEDLKIAHQIWTELVTRKAAIDIDPEHDVIHEVYDSWYHLFGRVRLLIADVPATQIHDNKSTKLLVDIAVKTLNEGLRPHLTKWQARYRHWYASAREKDSFLSPQELQQTYPNYDELITDMKRVNKQLKEYAEELKKLLS